VTPTDGEGLSVNWFVDLASHIQGEDLVVPPDSFFAMGDHRGVSLDSRYWGIHSAGESDRAAYVYLLVV